MTGRQLAIGAIGAIVLVLGGGLNVLSPQPFVRDPHQLVNEAGLPIGLEESEGHPIWVRFGFDLHFLVLGNQLVADPV